ncbi:MAG: hypothetical protein E2590_12805 [Chryseobacterium sp.]|nr:hypothetical protein [Chryseobacterium sp.]
MPGFSLAIDVQLISGELHDGSFQISAGSGDLFFRSVLRIVEQDGLAVDTLDIGLIEGTVGLYLIDRVPNDLTDGFLVCPGHRFRWFPADAGNR